VVRARNSWRVRASSRISPRSAEVTVWVSDAVSVDGAFAGRGHGVPMTHPPRSVEARGPDTESRGWIAALSATGTAHDDAVRRLHEPLVRAARFELARRRRVAGGSALAGQLDDLTMQAADDALMAILDKLPTYRGESRFTTWAYKFALLETGVKLRTHARVAGARDHAQRRPD